MSTNKTIVTKRKKIETSFEQMSLHASLIPIFLCEHHNYLLTLRGNHHPISISNHKFITGTRDIGRPKETSQHKWDNSMTVFPFFDNLPSTQQIDMKLPLQPLLPLQHLDIERMAQLALLSENSELLATPDTTRYGYTLTKQSFAKNMAFLQELSEHSLVDGKSAFDLLTFLLKHFNDDSMQLNIEMNDGNTDVEFSDESTFITGYNKFPARYYQGIRKMVQKKFLLRFGMIDGQHRSFGLYLRLLNRCTSDETVEMQWDEERTGKLNFKDTNIDSKMQIRFLTMRPIDDQTVMQKADVISSLIDESLQVSITNKTLMGDDNIDQMLNVLTNLDDAKISYETAVTEEVRILTETQTTKGMKAMLVRLLQWRKDICRRVVENDYRSTQTEKQPKMVAVADLFESQGTFESKLMKYLFSNVYGSAKMRYGEDKLTRNDVALFAFVCTARLDPIYCEKIKKILMTLGNQTFKVKQQKQSNMYVFEMQHSDSEHRDLGKNHNYFHIFKYFLTRRV